MTSYFLDSLEVLHFLDPLNEIEGSSMESILSYHLYGTVETSHEKTKAKPLKKVERGPFFGCFICTYSADSLPSLKAIMPSQIYLFAPSGALKVTMRHLWFPVRPLFAFSLSPKHGVRVVTQDR